jgi:hypothetical protein
MGFRRRRHRHHVDRVKHDLQIDKRGAANLVGGGYGPLFGVVVDTNEHNPGIGRVFPRVMASKDTRPNHTCPNPPHVQYPAEIQSFLAASKS